MNKRTIWMCIFLGLCAVDICAQTDAYFHIKKGVVQQQPLTNIDSVSYIAPEVTIQLPTEITIKGGTRQKLDVVITGASKEDIEWTVQSNAVTVFANGDSIFGVQNYIGNRTFVVTATCKGAVAHTIVNLQNEYAGGLSSLNWLLFNQGYVMAYSAREGMYLSQAFTSCYAYPDSVGGVPPTWAYNVGEGYKYGWQDFDRLERYPLWYEHCVTIEPYYHRVMQDTTLRNSNRLVASTIYLYSLMSVTDNFGVAPLDSSYWMAEPVLYPQERIYAYLDSAFTALMEHYKDPKWVNDRRDTESLYDPYHNDMAKWETFTQALYARFLLRKLPNWDNTPATCQRIIDVVDKVLNSGVWEEPVIPVYHSSYGVLSYTVPSTFLASVMGFYPEGVPTASSLKDENGKRLSSGPVFALDPRATRMMHWRRDYNNMAALRSLDNNAGMPRSMKYYYYPDLYCVDSVLNSYQSNPFTKTDNGRPYGYAEIPMMTTEELLFVKAEAQYWLGKKTDAYSTTKQAVERSMERYGVIDPSNTENPYHNMGDPKRVSGKGLIDFFFRLRMPEDNFTIAHLMQQKYVAMCFQSEQWVDVRRYNYSSPTNGVTYDGVYVYHVDKVYNQEKQGMIKEDYFSETFDLRRPYNLDTIWNNELDGQWVNRITVEQEYQKRYFINELKRLGIYQNTEWLTKKMIWQ